MLYRSSVLREDIRKSNKDYYSLKDKVLNIYKIPEMNYLVSNGIGSRDIYKMHDYKEIWTIGRFINRVKYYTIRELGKNFSRMPIEVEWREVNNTFKAFMWVPEYISQDLYNVTMGDLERRLGNLNLDIKLSSLPQRYCAQYLHTGSYNHIEASIDNMLEGLTKKGLKHNGRPQEIYMNHPHCNPPEKLKILIRQEIDGSSFNEESDIT